MCSQTANPETNRDLSCENTSEDRQEDWSIPIARDQESPRLNTELSYLSREKLRTTKRADGEEASAARETRLDAVQVTERALGTKATAHGIPKGRSR